MSTIKLTEEQVSKLKEIKQKSDQLSYELGQITRQKWNLEMMMESGKKLVEEHAKEDADFMKSIEEEYGAGSINLETFEFTPSEK